MSILAGCAIVDSVKADRDSSPGDNSVVLYSLDLKFLSGKPKQPGDIPSSPCAKIYLKNYTTDNEGSVTITPSCTTIGEFEYQIKRLKDELDGIVEKARKKFSSP